LARVNAHFWEFAMAPFGGVRVGGDVRRRNDATRWMIPQTDSVTL
jgi:hypothetical protein